MTWEFLPNWTWEINLITQLITQVVLANNWANIISFIKEVMKYFLHGNFVIIDIKYFMKTFF